MKKIYIFLAIILLISCSKLYTNKIYKEYGFTKKEIGSVISKYEITNKQFREFLLEDNNKKFTYDSTQWEKKLNIKLSSYHWHPAFDDYPIVNITYEAADAYCKWISKKYLLKAKNHHVIIRLPKPNEFDSLLIESVNELKGDFTIDYACNYLDNLKYLDPEDTLENYTIDGSFLTCSVKKYEQNGYYSIVGNVSELCQNRVIKGGNWYTLPSEIRIDKTYELPDPRVGFRVVLEKRGINN